MNQGTFLRNRRLTKHNLKIYQKVIPGEGSCLFHSLLDQIQSIPQLQDYASSHFELHWKIVSDGYKLFLETDKLSWPEWEDEEGLCGSKINWKNKMLDPKTSGDDVALTLASNLLESDIQVWIQCLESESSNL